MPDLAVYTTVYPGVEPYLAAWYRSLSAQTDREFDVWIGIDALAVRDVVEALGARPDATWVPAVAGDTHAQVRQRALWQLVDAYDAVVFVDSDDIMHPSRVAAARDALKGADVSGCALRLVDEQGRALGHRLTLPDGMQPADVLPRTNVFGLSNTVYRSTVLRDSLPLPADAVLVDWYLVTRAWLRGASLSFDGRVRMDYRQHGANTARVLPPFRAARVRQDTDRARRHFDVMSRVLSEEDLPARRAELLHTADEVARFQAAVADRPGALMQYVEALNALESPVAWWSSVAHPALRDLWMSDEETG